MHFEVELKLLWSDDNLYPEAQRPAAYLRGPEILENAMTYWIDKEQAGSRGQAAGRSNMKCQQTLTYLFIPTFVVRIVVYRFSFGGKSLE